MAKRKRRQNGLNSVGSDARELNALLSYGPQQYGSYSSGWTANRTEQIRVFKHWVYVAIHRIASEVASKFPNVSQVKGPKDASQPLDAGERQLARRWKWLLRQNKALIPLLSHQGLKPVRDNHPLVRLFADPNTPDVSWDLWYETIVFLFLTGTFYWWAPRNAKTGLPEALWVLPSHWVHPVFGESGNIEHYELRPAEGSYYRQIFPVEEIIVGRWKNPSSKIDGQSTVQAISEWVDTQNSVSSATNNAYRNGITPTVAIQFDASLNDPTSEMLQRIERKFLLRQQGVDNANRPLFLPPGVKLIPLSIRPNEMVFGDTAERTRDNILAAFAVPAIVAGIMKGMTNGSILAAQTGFYAFAINPLLRFLGQLLTEKLARQYDPTLRVWWEDYTPIDPNQRNQDIKTMLMGGAISRNEIRIANGYEPWDDSEYDEPLMPANMLPDSGGPGGHDDPDARNNPEGIDMDEDNKQRALDEDNANPVFDPSRFRKVQVIDRNEFGVTRLETVFLPLEPAGEDEPQ